MAEAPAMIDLFNDYMSHERNMSSETVVRYNSSLRSFEAFFKEQDCEMTWLTVDSDIIRNWMERLLDTGHCATTVSTHLSALRSFYRFALKRHLVSHNPAHGVSGPKKEKPLPQFVREKQMDMLLDEQEWGDNIKDVRARTIIILFYETGIRLSELIGLDDKDVDLDAMQLKVTGKRNKQRLIPFGEELAKTIEQYVAQRNRVICRQSDALLLTDKGQRMSKTQVYRIVKEGLSKVTTQKKRSPHVLRHSFATALLNHDAGLESVKKLLGHVSLQTTEIYTHTTFEQLKRVYEKAHPRA